MTAILLGGVAVIVFVTWLLLRARPGAGEQAPLSMLATTSEAVSSATTTLSFERGYRIIPLTIGSTQYRADIADTDALQELGLGNRASLGSTSAMLFVFQHPGRYAFWMKDMEFSIDMIWLDQNGKIVTIAADATPESYPKSFNSTGNASYVVEVPAGTAAKEKIKTGDTIIFDKNLLKKSSV
jgi:uncharacterized membrane protein (UPF0127 family)